MIGGVIKLRDGKPEKKIYLGRYVNRAGKTFIIETDRKSIMGQFLTKKKEEKK